MSIPEIASTVKALKHESTKIKTDDAESIETVNKLIEKLEEQLKQPSITSHQSLTEHMSSIVEKFEYQHPRITAIVNDLMVKLAGLGV